ncbi:CoA transferase subunit A [Brevundimonas sp. P7753]|uniref:CoA transferase subunit A n=1 Tax=Brevundimonas sp. P7753 TaxID=2726982 RepID=UPI0015BC788D|nr:CoA transferase subunit A [Brevundimonas sp. P7753]
MLDKRLDLDGFVASLRDGMTIGIGGWATRRKPMALVRAIARSDLKDLTIVGYGGPDVGTLVASGKVKKLIFGFVSLDHFPLDPHFRAARQAGALEILELDEGLLHWGLRAAAMRLPFLPANFGLATDIPSQGIKTIRSPYEDGQTLLAMPAIKLDAAILHVHRADQAGNTLIFSPDPFFDDLMARAADQVFVSTEQVVTTEELDLPANARFHPFERSVVTGVIDAPLGAHPTGASPDYGIDMAHLKTYVGATSPEDWADYRARFIDATPDAYLAAVGGADHVRALPAPIY